MCLPSSVSAAIKKEFDVITLNKPFSLNVDLKVTITKGLQGRDDLNGAPHGKTLPAQRNIILVR